MEESRAKHGSNTGAKWAWQRAGVAVAWLFTAIPMGHAQWLTQRLALQPGWNAIYLEVQPEPVYCNQIFAGLPIESVWKWDRQYSTVQFTEDPSVLIPEDPHWLAWLPPENINAFLGRLYALQAWQAYLVKVATNAAPFTLAIKGKVAIPSPEWHPQSLNLIGFPVHTNTPPCFSDFFAFTPEVDITRGYQNELYKIDANNRNIRIVQPARERIAPGRAYWVQCAGEPRQAAALDVTPSSPGGLDFGITGTKQNLEVRNAHPSNTITVLVRQAASEPAPDGQPEMAGPVAFSYLTTDASNNWVWLPLPSTGVTQAVAAGQAWTLQLGIRRGDMPVHTPIGTNGLQYQSILEVSDAERTLLARVPVVAQRLLVGPLAQVEEVGLWVGAAVLNQVNAPAYTNGLLETFSPMEMRLIVHVDALGQSRLLQQAILAWDAATTHYALYQSETNLPAGVETVSRISSVALPLMAPVALSGSMSNELTGTVTVPFDDPVNPFLHRYHPMHDNKDWDFKPYTNAVETYTIERTITLEAVAITNSAHPGVADTAAGIYRETLTGLRAQPICVEGAFYLKRISMAGELK